MRLPSLGFSLPTTLRLTIAVIDELIDVTRLEDVEVSEVDLTEVET